MNHKSDDDAFTLSLSDLKEICKRSKKKIMRAAAIGAILAASFALMNTTWYTAEGTFRERLKSDSSSKNSAMLFFIGDEKDNSAISMIKSRKIIEAAVKKLNLQAEIEPYDSRPAFYVSFLNLLERAKTNLQAEYAHLSQRATPFSEKQNPTLTVKNLNYTDEVPLKLQIELFEDETFSVADEKGTLLGTGKIGTLFSLENLYFTLNRETARPLTPQMYLLTLQPSKKITDRLLAKLKITSDYNDKLFLTLNLRYPSRQGVSQILNTIMESYRDYLIEEHHRSVENQVAYLKERQEEMDTQLANLLGKHAESLSSYAGNLDLLVSTQQNFKKRLLNIDLDIEHLQKGLQSGSQFYENYFLDNDPAVIHTTLAEIRSDKLQCDSIDLALCHFNPAKTGQEKQEPFQEFQGIDLKTANGLFVSYSQEMHEIEANILQNQFVLEQMQSPEFELSSLTTILNDSVSKELISKASSAALAMKEETARTARELERLQADLDLQRNFLRTHIKQMIELLKLRADLLKGKIYALQNVSLQLLRQKISIQEKHLHDYALQRINSLKHEQEIIDKQQKELQNRFDKIPEQWATEKLIDMHLESNATIMEQIGNLIESKNIADNLEATLSAPFDLARPPLHADSQHILLYAFFGAFLGAFFILSFDIVKSALTGIQATVENLRSAKQHVSGILQKFKRPDGTYDDTNLSTLRRLSSYLCESNSGSHCLVIIKGKSLDYSASFSELLAKRNLKVLLMDISFDAAADSTQEGLLQYLENPAQDVKITKKGSYDYIASGGKSNFSKELIESICFKNLLKTLSTKYDWIVVVSDAMPLSIETESLLTLFDFAAISIENETLQDLKSIFNFASDKYPNKKISFILY